MVASARVVFAMAAEELFVRLSSIVSCSKVAEVMTVATPRTSV